MLSFVWKKSRLAVFVSLQLIFVSGVAAQEPIQLRALRDEGNRGEAKKLEPVPLPPLPKVRRPNGRFAKQIRQLMLTELHFVRVVCQPKKDVFATIVAESHREIGRLSGALALDRELRPHERRHSDPRRLLADYIGAVVNANLTVEQANRYHTALAHRQRAREEAALAGLVAKLDGHLLLTSEQRKAVRSILELHWQDSWSHSQVQLNGEPYFPHLPAHALLAVLTPSQRAAWHGIYRQSSSVYGLDFGMLQGIEIEKEEPVVVRQRE